MNKPDPQLEALEDRASEWLVRRDAGLTPAEQAELDRWLAADPRHYAAFAEMESALASLNRPRELGHEATVTKELAAWEEQERINRIGAQRRKLYYLRLGLAAAAAVVLVSLAVWKPWAQPETPSLATVSPKPERQQLPDGSVVELNANSEIAVDYSLEKRGVHLLRGEVHFDVAKNPARPFVVTVGNVEVRAVGTAFVVRLDPATVDVLVTEGKVTVAQAAPLVSSSPSAPPIPAPIFVSAGARVAVPVDGSGFAPQVEPVTPVEINTALAWREMRFEFTNTSLAEAVDLFNHKSKVHVTLEDPSLAELRVSGIYWANNPEGFAKLLESSFDIEARQDGPDHIVLRHRR